MTTPNEIITAASLNSLRTAVASTLTGKYGQPMSSAALPQTGVAKLSDVRSVLSDLNALALHQTGANNPVFDSLSKKGVIKAIDIDNAYTHAAAYLTNYLTVDNSRVGVTSNVAVASSSAAWSYNIALAKNVNFASTNDIDYFFNSGGEIRLVLAHNSNATLQDTAWQTLLASVGTIVIGSNYISRSGTIGTVTSNFGALTKRDSSFNIVFAASNVGSGAYLNSSVQLQIATNPSSISIRVDLFDNHTGSLDSIANATTLTFNERVPTFLSFAARSYT